MSEKYLATIIDHHDPLKIGRIRVKCPELYGDSVSPWCLPSFAPGNYHVPLEGTLCWIELRQCNTNYPIWTGVLPKINGEDTPEFFKSYNDSPDAAHHFDATVHATNQTDNADHRKLQGHNHPPYYDPYRYCLIYPMGEGFYVDGLSGSRSVGLYDSIGQGVFFGGEPTGTKDSNTDTNKRSNKSFMSDSVTKAPSLRSDSTTKQNTGYRAIAGIGGAHKQKLIFGVKDDINEEELLLINSNPNKTRFTELFTSNKTKDIKFEFHQLGKFYKLYSKIDDDGTEYIELKDRKNQTIKIVTKDDEELIIIQDYKGSKFELNPANNNMRMEHYDGSYIEIKENNGVFIYSDTSIKLNSTFIELTGDLVKLQGLTAVQIETLSMTITSTGTINVIGATGVTITGPIRSEGW